MASPSTTSTPAGSTTERRTGTRWRSVSTATTVAPVSARARVKEPSPAPISRTWEPVPAPESRAIRRTVLGSATKFCPSARLGRIPCADSSWAMSAPERVTRRL